MDREYAMIDVTNLEDCRHNNNIQVIREIFEDARNRLEQGEEIMLLQTQHDSPPEFLERISSRDRLDEIAGYYLP